MKYGKSFGILLLTFCLFQACTRNPLAVDISNIQLSIDFLDVDSVFLGQDQSATERRHQTLTSTLGDLYLYEVSMNLKTGDTAAFAEGLVKFYTNEYILLIEAEKQKIKSESIQQEQLILDGMRYLRYHFDSLAVPTRIFYVNKLFSGLKANDSTISIGLENYIDPKSKVVEQIPNDNLYQWQKDRMDIRFLARDVLQFWIQHQLFQEIDDHLAHHIIQAGKINYVLKAALPKASDALILRYSDSEIAWAEENEYAFWEYLVRENLLFKNNLRDKTNFLNEGPYTVGLPEKGPDRLGQYLGYKIVSNYMRKNKGLSLQELLETDFNTILQSYDI
jgi:hypothetical protein